MTFRARLLQAIISLVTATTAASLFIAQQQNSATHQVMLAQLFEGQVNAFRREQERDLDLAARNARRLSESVRLFAALEAGDPDTYKVAADELRLEDFDFFRLADAEGTIIEPPPGSRASAGLFAPALQGSLRAQLRPSAPTGTGLMIGFIEIGSPEQERIYRVISCAITNFDQTVGALILGQEMLAFQEAIAAESADHNGMPALWLRGRLISAGLASELNAGLLPHLSARLGNAAGGQEKMVIKAAGVRHRVLSHCLNPGSNFPPAFYLSIFSLAGFEARQRTLIWHIFLLGAASVVVASFVGSHMARLIAQPIHSLVHATHAIQQGNYQPQIMPGSTVEMKTLAASFHEMAAGLALKERYHSVLSMVADARVAEQLMAGNIQLGGEVREVTVVFCDIRGYTALSAGRDPREVIALLNTHMGALTRVVYRWHGVINQFAGDALMILFGAPTSHGRDAVNAVHCALELLAERQRLNIAAAEPLGIGIGIATGNVVAGCIGAENRADYTVVGERVNLAARLCSVAVAGQVVVDGTTHAMLPPGNFVTTPLEPLRLKGFAETVSAWQVLADTQAEGFFQ